MLLLLRTSLLPAQTDSCGEAGLQLAQGMLWRGYYYPGINLQGQASLQHPSGLSLSCWAFGNREGHRMGELRMGYERRGLKAGLTYLRLSEPTPWGRARNLMLEAELGYRLGDWTLAWATNLGGEDHTSERRRAYSSYLQLHYQRELRRLQLQVWAGFTPWGGMYASQAGLVELSAWGNYALWQRRRWACSLQAQLTYAHAGRATYASLGLGIGL